MTPLEAVKILYKIIRNENASSNNPSANMLIILHDIEKEFNVKFDIEEE